MYRNWILDIHYHIIYTDYVYLDDLMKVIRLARRIQFYDLQIRKEIFNMLMNIQRFTINYDNRAPNNLFANISNGSFADILKNILHALDYGVKDMYYESIKRLYKLISSDLTQLYNFGIYTQNTFETSKSLKWYEVEGLPASGYRTSRLSR